MKNYLKHITLGAALLMLAGGCTDKFEEYNTNQYQIHEADPATLMKSMIETIVNIQQNDSQMMDQMVGQLGGYLCCSIQVMHGVQVHGILRLKRFMETFSKFRKQQILQVIIMHLLA